MNQTKVYLDEFPVNEEGLLLVSDVALIEALRRRAERQKEARKAHTDESTLGVKPS